MTRAGTQPKSIYVQFSQPPTKNTLSKRKQKKLKIRRMNQISDENVKALLISDFDSSLSKITGIPDNGFVLRDIVESCHNIISLSGEMSSSEQFSVAVTLPAVSCAAREATIGVQNLLMKVLTFTSGEDVSVRDVKDWSFVEDCLDSVFSHLDEAIACATDTVPRKSLSIRMDTIELDPSRPQSAWVVDNFRPKFVPHAISSEIPSAMRECLSLERSRVMDSLFIGDGDIGAVSDINATRLVFLDTESSLDEMIQEIILQKEVAMDLEHHDLHSYRGFTCLIQLSTVNCDYIVDPFPLFGVLNRMNAFTANRQILKILHGAEMDIQWLQRDFGVYIVNMFDTGQAARVLTLPGGYGLGNLLDFFCKVKTNKRFQTADWRIRPLSREMINYARMDTHYLIFVKNCLVRDLLAMGGDASVYGKRMLVQVIEKSIGIASRVYTEDEYPPSVDQFEKECLQLCLKSAPNRVGTIRTNPAGLAALTALLRWRDFTGRTLDESKHWVLSNAACFRLANALPISVAQILRVLAYEANSGPWAPMRITNELAGEMLHVLTNVSSTSLHETTTTHPTDATHKTQQNTAIATFGKIVHATISPVRDDTRTIYQLNFGDKISSLANLLSIIPNDGEAVVEEIRSKMSFAPMIEVNTHVDTHMDTSHMDTAHVDASRADTPLPTTHSEFVSFDKIKQPTIDYDNGELPPTVAETRKTEKRKSQAHQPPKPKIRKVQNAAEKALDFIENELGQTKKHKK